MRIGLRLLRPAANQTGRPGLWQDPVKGYWEQHGKMEFVAGEDYGLTMAEKQAVLDRHLMKEALKKEFLRLEYNPHTFRYKTGIVVDPAVYRWYAADMTHLEHYRWTPKSFYLVFGGLFLTVFVVMKGLHLASALSDDACRDGRILWWDRQNSYRATAHDVNQGVCGGEFYGPF